MLGVNLPRTNSQMVYKCDRCNVTMSDKVGIQMHSKMHLFWCHLCQFDLEDYESYRMHIMRKHRPSSAYYEVNKEDSSKSNSNQCIQSEYGNKSVTNSVERDFCENNEVLNEQLQNDAKEKIGKNSIDSLTEKILQDDINSSGMRECKTPVSSKIETDQFICKLCFKKFSDFKEHNCIKMSQNICNACCVQFPEKSDLDQHISSKHMDLNKATHKLTSLKVKNCIQLDDSTDISSNISDLRNSSTYTMLSSNPSINSTPVQNNSTMSLNSVINTLNNFQVISADSNVESEINVPSSKKSLDIPQNHNFDNLNKMIFKYLKFCKSLKYPLPSRLLKKVILMHDVVSKYLSAQTSQTKDTVALKKLHKVLESVILKHNDAIN